MKELFLVSFGGIQYGIWKDAILSVRGLDALHRIPLSPACIAGILIDDGQTVTLADLPACIGYEHLPETGQGSILLLKEDEKVTGFVVNGEIDTRSIPPELLFPLPEFLKTPVFDSCAVHDGIPVPIINIAELYSRVMQTGEESPVNSLRISAALPQDISRKVKIRIFSVGGELFAASAAGFDDKPVKPGAVTPLPNMPQYVKGVAFRDGHLLPVIDLSQRIKRQGAATESLMLIAKIGGGKFGLLVDGDEGTLPAKKVAIKPVPMIAQSPWLKHIAVRAGELIPLIDLAMALSPDAAEKPIWQRYTSDSRFPDLFCKRDVEVMEFSLLGERHALPKQEVEDVIAFKPCRALPDLPPIVIGVAEHNGEILPVVDLAMMFGRRSLATPAWRMVLVNSGDFRALVITETVFKERRLPLDIHRAVPIHLPHDLMYGCYPDAEAVRLILNVEAISVHFEKSLIQKFLPALSHEMRMMSMEAEPVHKIESAAALSTAEPEALAVQEQASVHQEADEPVPELQQQAAEEIIEPVEVHEAVTETPAIAPESEQASEPMDAEIAAVPSEKTQESLSSSGEWSEWDTDEVPEAEQPEDEAPVPSEDVPEEAMGSVAASELSPDEEYIATEIKDWAAASTLSAAEIQQQADEDYVEFTEVMGTVAEAPAIAPEQVNVVLAAALSESTQEFPSYVNELGAMPEDKVFEQEHVPHTATVSEEMIMPEIIAIATEQTKISASLQSVPVQQSSGESGKAAEPIVIVTQPLQSPAQEVPATASMQSAPVQNQSETMLATSTGQEVEPLAVLSEHEDRTARAWKRGIAFGVIAAALIAVLFYFAGTSDKPSIEKPVKVAEQAKLQAVPAMTKVELVKEKAARIKVQTQQAKAKNVPPRPAEKLRAPLELDIPASMPINIDVYVVKEGDTLWSISEHFTGTPFNYPRIAGENRIADPNLIFPGQRIRLIK